MKKIDEIIADGIEAGLLERNDNPDDIAPYVLMALEAAGYDVVALAAHGEKRVLH
jgi:hypothetical protein